MSETFGFLFYILRQASRPLFCGCFCLCSAFPCRGRLITAPTPVIRRFHRNFRQNIHRRGGYHVKSNMVYRCARTWYTHLQSRNLPVQKLSCLNVKLCNFEISVTGIK